MFITASVLSQSFIDIVADLSRRLSPDQRYSRLLKAFKTMFPCDAAALLRLEDSALVPLAVDGLSTETLGRKFIPGDHPRLAILLNSSEPVRFPADSDLPDPYDGLIRDEKADPQVHDCLGCALSIDGQPWGVLTLDALDYGTFDDLDRVQLQTFIHLAEATVKAAELITRLEQRVQQEHRIAREVQADIQQSMVGKSQPLRALEQEISTVADSDLTVLICGETGVGKELVARALHDQSSRSDKPLIYVNCAALPENLVESELFGHVKGAFTGALNSRAGKFELASEGTLFLDEIGEIPLATQTKLLRVLQSGEIQRVGSDRHLRVDVRVISATNRDLKQEVADGHFRADLYHRLSVYPIHVPPLRERGRDILLLCGYFLERNSRRMGLPRARLAPGCDNLLMNYQWPGNIRELEHCVSRALLKARADTSCHHKGMLFLHPDHLDIRLASSTPDQIGQVSSQDQPISDGVVGDFNLQSAVREFQRRYILRVLDKSGGNLAGAARQLGMDRGNFYRLVKRLELTFRP